MNPKTADHAQEFDEYVTKYNEWLASLENSKIKSWRALFKGMSSVLDVIGSSFGARTSGYDHPLYSLSCLSPQQKMLSHSLLIIKGLIEI